MSELYNSLSNIGYHQQPNTVSGMAQFNHGADKNDPDHLDNLSGVMQQNGYRQNPSSVNPTFVNKNDDTDAISLHDDPNGGGHRLFHDAGDSSSSNPVSSGVNTPSVHEGFEIVAQHATGAGPTIKNSAKTNQEAKAAFMSLRKQYPRHNITVKNKHTGMATLYRASKQVAEEAGTEIKTEVIVNTSGKKTLSEMFEPLTENWGTMSREAKDLVLHADNSAMLHHQSKAPIMKNLNGKMAKGTYDHTKAKKLWAYHADRAAQNYAEKKGNGTPWHKQFSTSVRREAAQHWADMHKDNMSSASAA